MKTLKRVVTSSLVLMLVLSVFALPVKAAEGLIQSIVANTKIGANDKEVYSFDITVNDADKK